MFVNSDAFLGSFMVVEHVLGQNLISSKESLCTNEKTSWKKRHVENVQVKYIKYRIVSTTAGEVYFVYPRI